MCPWLVLVLSIPIFGGLLWSFRRLAAVKWSAQHRLDTRKIDRQPLRLRSQCNDSGFSIVP